MNNERDLRDMTPEKIYVTWDQVEEFITNIGAFIKANNFNGVYGPARGGLVFAVMISHRYHLPFLGAPQPGCLIVDDIIDTGDTAKAWANKGYVIASMFFNSDSPVKANYYMYETEGKWLIFPWELSINDVLVRYPNDEIWVSIPGYCSRYSISTKGRIFGKISNKLLSYPPSNINLYSYKGDRGKLYKLQDLLCGAFKGLDFQNPYHNRVLFIDGDKTNYSINNLVVEDMSDIPGEDWKLINEWKGHAIPEWYYISSLGRVKTVPRDVICIVNSKQVIKQYPGHILKGTPDSDGYLYVDIRDIEGNSLMAYIHRLVAKYFITNPRDLNEVNHIDGVKTNNAASNLEWCTHLENMKHAYDIGLFSSKLHTKEKI